MADDSDKQDAPKLPPKLNLRKQGVLKQERADTAEPPAEAAPEAEAAAPKLTPKPPAEGAKQSTARLVVKPAAPKPAEKPAEEPDEEPAEASEPAPILAATEATAKEASPAIKLKPLKPKPSPAAKAPKPPEAKEAAPAKTNTKRKTSRIPLESAKAPETKGEQGEAKATTLKPKTIKIKPTAPVPKVRSTQPLSITVPIAEADSDKIHTDAAKRKTSRIPLEEALTADTESEEPAEAADPARPKTIKIKRPGSEASTVKARKPAPAKAADDGEMSKTARLDSLPLDEADATPTQKKTIRVKRPDAASTATSAPAAPPRPGLGLTPPEPIEERSDEPGVVWAILALAAMIVLCVVIYMLAAQAVGPNVSGTALSSWTDGPNLSWPGKIVN